MELLVINSRKLGDNYMSQAEQTSELFYAKEQIQHFQSAIIDHQKDPFHAKWFETQKEYILRLADAMKSECVLEKREDDVKKISVKIKEWKDEAEINSISDKWVEQVLPKEFKRGYTMVTKSPIDKLQEFDSNYVISTLYELDDEELRRRHNKAKSAIDHVEFVAKQRGTALVGGKHKRDIISTVYPTEDDSTDTYQAALDVFRELKVFTDNWQGVVEKVKKFPITDKKKDRECALKIRSLANMFSGFGALLPSCKDLKHAQSLWRWFDTIVEESRHGKHAAAVYKKIQAIGEVQGKWRPLTRERVGDIKEKLWADMQKFSKAMDIYAWWIGLAQWRDEYGEVSQRVADRRIREGPRLSESAFSADE